MISHSHEKANPDTLYGVFGDAQWTNKDRFEVLEEDCPQIAQIPADSRPSMGDGK